MNFHGNTAEKEVYQTGCCALLHSKVLYKLKDT